VRTVQIEITFANEINYDTVEALLDGLDTLEGVKLVTGRLIHDAVIRATGE